MAASFFQPSLGFAGLGLGVAGALVGLALMNPVGSLLPLLNMLPLREPIDMITMLGFLILMGSVVIEPMLVIDEARQNLNEAGGGLVEAVGAAVQSRLRPIAMTTLTTFCGLAPLVLFGGEETELYRCVGAIVLFSLLGTALVTVTFLPALVVLVLGLGRRIKIRSQAA